MNYTSDALKLLEAIRLSPDEDVPCLMLADELEANGDPARAELIRVQIAAANGDDPVRAELVRRAIEICRDNRARWEHVGCPLCHGSRKRLRFKVCGDEPPKLWPLDETVSHRAQLLDLEQVDCECVAYSYHTDVGGLSTPMQGADGRFAAAARTVEYVRGMKCVHCNERELWALHAKDVDQTAGGSHRREWWEPTEWAKRVCRHHPDVMMFWLEDKQSNRTYHEDSRRPCHVWWRESNGPILHQLPNPVFDKLLDRHKAFVIPRRRITCDTFDTAYEARLALARTAMLWVRLHL